MPFVVIPGHLNLKGSLYEEARRIATRVTLVVAEALNKNGFDEIVVADSHGPMVNLLIDDLPEYVELIRGYPRPVSMVSGVEGCDVAVFLGYHAKFGTAKSSFDHTYSGSSVNRVTVNGIPASEFLLNAYVLGEHGIPVIMVAGEAQLLTDDVAKHTPWVENVTLKHSLSRVSARSFSMTRIDRELQAAVKRATTKFRQKKTKPLTTRKPVKMGISFMTSLFADVAELLPAVTRLNGLQVEYTAKNMVDAYNTFELLILAASATTYLLAELK
jgi:D-amino peptidase